MPYYVHLKTADPDTGYSYPDGTTARAACDHATHKVTFVASEDESYAWQEREKAKFRTGIYINVPWIMASGGYQGASYNLPEAVALHFPHLSIKSPGLIAYTKTAEHGILDRQTAIKPGRYLEEYLKVTYSAEQIADFIAQCKSVLECKIARTEREIVAIYSKKNSGFSSCMQSKSSPDYAWQRPFENGDRPHPCAVYGDSDLGVAYLGSIEGKITARAVVWPDNKVFTRVYGDQSLSAILTANGYTVGNMDGARIRLIKANGRIVMPYIDGIDGARTDGSGKYIVLGDGELSTGETCGYADGHEDRSYDDDDGEDYDSNDTTCDHCGDRFCYDNERHGRLNRTHCSDCLDNRDRCDRCDTDDWDLDLEHVGGEYWCSDCRSSEEKTCDHTWIQSEASLTVQDCTYGSEVACSHTWIEEGFDPDVQSDREDRHVTDYCVECSKDQQGCYDCGILFALDLTQCPACGLTVRCDSTPNMFTFEPLDGAIWWTANPNQTAAPRGTYWVKTADGGTYYTSRAENWRLQGSVFETLDDSDCYQRVEDPRLAIARTWIPTADPIPSAQESVF